MGGGSLGSGAAAGDEKVCGEYRAAGAQFGAAAGGGVCIVGWGGVRAAAGSGGKLPGEMRRGGGAGSGEATDPVGEYSAG